MLSKVECILTKIFGEVQCRFEKIFALIKLAEILKSFNSINLGKLREIVEKIVQKFADML